MVDKLENYLNYKINYINRYITYKNNCNYIIVEGYHIRSNGEVILLMEVEKKISANL